MLGINTRANWTHRISHELFLTLGYQFSRFSSRVTPYYANRENISGNAGIQGNNQAPVNWGPPSLNFTSGIATLTDGLPSFNRNQTSAESVSVLWNHGRHSVTVGGDFRRQQFNYLSQQDPRGTFTFTGAATGADFADFLLGIPDTSSIAFGNADKYFRQSVYDAYIADDWRVRPELTVNAGVRWEYGAPITELYDRLVNLDISPGFIGGAGSGKQSGAIPQFAHSPGQKGFRAARGDCLASTIRIVVGDTRRRWRLLQHVRVSIDRFTVGPAAAAIEDVERTKQFDESIHARERI